MLHVNLNNNLVNGLQELHLSHLTTGAFAFRVCEFT